VHLFFLLLKLFVSINLKTNKEILIEFEIKNRIQKLDFSEVFAILREEKNQAY
jgi:hypothetical protein